MKNGRYQENGIELWYFNDQLHREDGPACVEDDGTQSWYVYGKLHRTDGPAVIWGDGSQEWYLNGERHREGAPAVVNADGSCRWYINGNLHRVDGPAVEGADGTREWHRHGKRVPDEDDTPQAFNHKKVVEIRSAHDQPVKVVENRILALRKKFLEDGGTSQGTKMKPRF
ncbi:hypothetical protein [Burkholderia pseudomallei]|uniref:hypothetical protein n=1 Tax=Burkholderia pseudomallei TaxID=28450 RepID=UPI001AD7244F|nr:hypothetical protein [Burkholderia pseudomallei]MBO7803469.1 hypothetical protein [Burkholderia pseudomallei]